MVITEAFRVSDTHGLPVHIANSIVIAIPQNRIDDANVVIHEAMSTYYHSIPTKGGKNTAQ